MPGGICGAYKNTKGARAHIKGIPSAKKYRPCIVDGKKALFHRWADKGKLVVQLQGMFTGKEIRETSQHIYQDDDLIMTDRRSDIMQMQYTYGIVEFADGRVSEGEPSKIRFTDNMVNKTLNTVAEKPKE